MDNVEREQLIHVFAKGYSGQLMECLVVKVDDISHLTPPGVAVEKITRLQSSGCRINQMLETLFGIG